MQLVLQMVHNLYSIYINGFFYVINSSVKLLIDLCRECVLLHFAQHGVSRPHCAASILNCDGIEFDMKRHLILLLLGVAVPAQAQTYVDPAGSGAIVGAVNWLQGTLLGTVATVVAVIAVASVGFLMLTGRMNWRYGATVILGCFILFGAASIVGGIQQTAALGG